MDGAASVLLGRKYPCEYPLFCVHQSCGDRYGRYCVELGYETSRTVTASLPSLRAHSEKREREAKSGAMGSCQLGGGFLIPETMGNASTGHGIWNPRRATGDKTERGESSQFLDVIIILHLFKCEFNRTSTSMAVFTRPFRGHQLDLAWEGEPCPKRDGSGRS